MNRNPKYIKDFNNEVRLVYFTYKKFKSTWERAAWNKYREKKIEHLFDMLMVSDNNLGYNLSSMQS